MFADTIFLMDGGSIRMYIGNYSSFRLQRQNELSDLSSKKLAYLSRTGMKRYVVYKNFTVWTTKKKHKLGEEVFIGEHNEKLYEWAIKSKFLRPAGSSEKKK